MPRRFHDEALSALHMRGQDLYRQKQYEAALQCFNEVLSINQDAKAPVAILDNRAATYTKLGNLRAALSDGRQMIQQEKANCLGYLRTGKILQLMGQHEVALDLYEMGTRKVPSSDSNIMSLRGQHDKLTRQLAPAKAIDPLQMLPLELVKMTINYLEFRHIVGLLRVSKTWLQLLASIPSLWSDLDFSTAKKPVNLGAIREYIKRGNGTTTRVTLDRFGSNADKIPRYVATRCRGLKELRISGGLIGASILEAVPCLSNLKSLIISKSCTIPCDVASQLLENCPNLERAEFQSISSTVHFTAWEVDMPKIRTLAFDLEKPAKELPTCFLWLERLLSRIPNIHTLSVQGWTLLPSTSMGEPLDFSNLHQLQYLDISRLDATLPPRLPLNIRTIVMANCGRDRAHRFSFVDLNLSQMVRLSLAGWSGLSLSDLRACLLPSKGKVTHLDIGDCVNLSSADLKELITQGYLEAVEDFVLKACNVNDEVAILTAKNLPHLKNLDVACSKITGVGVKALVIGLEGKLEHLCLDGCHSTNIDAVELARAMGVKVSFAFPESWSGGRKIIQR